jgi:hypothetical protein
MVQNKQTPDQDDSRHRHFVFIAFIIVSIMALLIVFDILSSLDSEVKEELGYPQQPATGHSAPGTKKPEADLPAKSGSMPTPSVPNNSAPAPTESAAPTATPTPISSAPLPHSVLLAVTDPDQTPAPSDQTNPMKEFKIISFDPQSAAQTDVAEVRSNFFTDSFQYEDGKLYFINLQGELSALTLGEADAQTIKIDGITPTDKYLTDNTLYDIVLSGDQLFYLKGSCSEREYCALGEYDLSSGTNRIILDGLQNKTGTLRYSEIRLADYDAQSGLLKVEDSSGRDGYAVLSFFTVDPQSGTLTKTDSASLSLCGDDSSPCTKEQDAENERYAKLSAMPPGTCGASTFSYSPDHSGLIFSGPNAKTFEESKFISCLK